MKNQWEIENEWDVAKLLVTNMNHKMIMFKLPQYGLYVEKISPILVDHPRQPHIVSVRIRPNIIFSGTSPPVSLPQQSVAKFIQECPEFRAYRIFKHGTNFSGIEKKNVIGIICETTKNMLHLYPGKTFNISSKNKELRKLFYEKAVQINEEDKLGCLFDYDKYDYTLEIRAYKRFKDDKFHRWAVITILYGKDLPNSWSMGAGIEGGEM